MDDEFHKLSSVSSSPSSPLRAISETCREIQETIVLIQESILITQQQRPSSSSSVFSVASLPPLSLLAQLPQIENSKISDSTQVRTSFATDVQAKCQCIQVQIRCVILKIMLAQLMSRLRPQRDDIPSSLSRLVQEDEYINQQERFTTSPESSKTSPHAKQSLFQTIEKIPNIPTTAKQLNIKQNPETTPIIEPNSTLPVFDNASSSSSSSRPPSLSAQTPRVRPESNANPETYLSLLPSSSFSSMLDSSLNQMSVSPQVVPQLQQPMSSPTNESPLLSSSSQQSSQFLTTTTTTLPVLKYPSPFAVSAQESARSSSQDSGQKSPASSFQSTSKSSLMTIPRRQSVSSLESNQSSRERDISSSFSEGLSSDGGSNQKSPILFSQQPSIVPNLPPLHKPFEDSWRRKSNSNNSDSSSSHSRPTSSSRSVSSVVSSSQSARSPSAVSPRSASSRSTSSTASSSRSASSAVSSPSAPSSRPAPSRSASSAVSSPLSFSSRLPMLPSSFRPLVSSRQRTTSLIEKSNLQNTHVKQRAKTTLGLVAPIEDKDDSDSETESSVYSADVHSNLGKIYTPSLCSTAIQNNNRSGSSSKYLVDINLQRFTFLFLSDSVSSNLLSRPISMETARDDSFYPFQIVTSDAFEYLSKENIRIRQTNRHDQSDTQLIVILATQIMYYFSTSFNYQEMLSYIAHVCMLKLEILFPGAQIYFLLEKQPSDVFKTVYSNSLSLESDIQTNLSRLNSLKKSINDEKNIPNHRIPEPVLDALVGFLFKEDVDNTLVLFEYFSYESISYRIKIEEFCSTTTNNYKHPACEKFEFNNLENATNMPIPIFIEYILPKLIKKSSIKHVIVSIDRPRGQNFKQEYFEKYFERGVAYFFLNTQQNMNRPKRNCDLDWEGTAEVFIQQLRNNLDILNQKIMSGDTFKNFATYFFGLRQS